MQHFSIDGKGYYGEFGGAYIPEILHQCVTDLKEAYLAIIESKSFQKEFNRLLHDYVGRPSPLYYSNRLSERFGGEDISETGRPKPYGCT